MPKKEGGTPLCLPAAARWLLWCRTSPAERRSPILTRPRRRSGPGAGRQYALRMCCPLLVGGVLALCYRIYGSHFEDFLSRGLLGDRLGLAHCGDRLGSGSFSIARKLLQCL